MTLFRRSRCRVNRFRIGRAILAGLPDEEQRKIGCVRAETAGVKAEGPGAEMHDVEQSAGKHEGPEDMDHHMLAGDITVEEHGQGRRGVDCDFSACRLAS